MFAPVPNDEGNNEPNPDDATTRASVRRKALFRSILMFCLMMLLLNPKNNPHSTVSKNNTEGNGEAEIKLLGQHSTIISEIVSTSFVSPTNQLNSMKSLNVTGFYRGVWTDIALDANLTGHAPGTGLALLRTKSVKIRHVKDLEFVYGVLKVYGNRNAGKSLAVSMVTEILKPVQGVYINSQRRLLLFDTPSREQKLFLQIYTSKHFNTSAVAVNNNHNTIALNSTSSSVTHVENDEDEENTEVTSTTGDTPHNHHTNHTQHNKHNKHSRQLSSTTSLTRTYITPHNETHSVGRLAIVIATRREMNRTSAAAVASSQHNAGAHDPYHLFVSIELGENSLTPEFKMLQSPYLSYPTADSLYGDLPGMNTTIDTLQNTQNTQQTSQHNAQVISEVSPFTYRYPPPTTKDSANTVTHTAPVSIQRCQYVLDMAVGEGGNSGHGNLRGKEGVDESASEIRGSIGDASGAAECGQTLLTMGTFKEELASIEHKVDIYVGIVAAVTVSQIMLSVLQLRHCSTPALNARTSITGVFAQALLDGMLTFLHIVLGTSMSGMYFSRFIWIAVLKMILFAALLMRMGIGAYIAQFQSELSLEGSVGLRRRLISLHLKFYGVLMVCMIVGIAVLPDRPLLTSLLLYSYWIPQIVYSAHNGTKHSFHSAYLVGITLSRLFIPLYFLWCPENFIIPMHAYLNPGVVEGYTPVSFSAGLFVVVWTVGQMCLLFAQQKYGPRFFIPSSFLPQRYNYARPIPHHLLHEHDANTTSNNTTNEVNEESVGLLMTILPSGRHSTSTSGSSGRDIESGPLDGERVLECVICCNPVVNLREAQSSPETAYMITPCDHVFHARCLCEWAQVKMECPVCRAPMPELDEDNRGGEDSRNTLE